MRPDPAGTPPADLTVVIVHHRTPDLLRPCLSRLLRAPPRATWQAIVVDNPADSVTASAVADEFPQVQWVHNTVNVGFAAACNQGLQRARGLYCLLLNPDARIDGATLDGLLASMAEHPRAGVVAPRLVYPDGTLQLSCRRFPTLRAVLLRGLHLRWLCPSAVDAYLMADWDHATLRPVDWVIGACLLLRREALDAVGALDEGYFLYYEDADLCLRMKQVGWDVLYDPELTVEHQHRRESASLLPRRQTVAHLLSLIRLFRKHPLGWW